MSKDKDTDKVIEILKSLNFSADKISVASQDGKRADIIAERDENSYLIEVKSRLDHPSLISEIKESKDFEIVEYEKKLCRSNSLSSIINDAVDQLDQTPNVNHAFKVIWFRAIESLIEDEISFIKATLYGKKHLLARDKNGKISHAECYYYDFNDFFEHQTLDAVILDNGQGLELCVNDFSNRVEEFRKCSLFRLFSDNNSVIDPVILKSMNQIYVADTNVSRNNEPAVKDYVEKKYNVHIQVLNMNSFGGVITYTEAL